MTQNPRDARVLYAMRLHHENMDDYEQAAQFYEQAQDRNSPDISAAVERINY